MLGHSNDAPSSCALETTQSVRNRTVLPRESVRHSAGIDLGLDREHDAHETEVGRVCEFD